MELNLRDLHKSYDAHPVLRGASLELPKTQVLALIGPSGGGKSTLLRILAGLIAPDRGSITIDGQQIPRDEAGLRAFRRTVGMVFQAYNLFPHLTALQNLRLPLEKVHGHSPAAAVEIAMAALRRFQLEDHAHKKPGALSGGQQQRVALARALAIQPQLILFDEPTSAIDPEMTGEVLNAITELKQDGRDFILVTHEMGFAREIADHVALLSGGQIAECAPPALLFSQPQQPATRKFLASVLRA